MVKLWNGAGDPMCAWRAHGEPVTCLSSLGAAHSGSEDGTVCVWDAAAAAGENALPDLGPIRFGFGAPRSLLTLDAAGPAVGVHATRAPRGGGGTS